MGMVAAKQGDLIIATDTHVEQTPMATTPTPHSFRGVIDGDLSQNVRIMGQPAAVVGSTATNTPPHTPTHGVFQRPPSNRGRIISGSDRVLINGKPAARAGDTAMTCNDPADLPVGEVVVSGTGTVLVG